MDTIKKIFGFIWIGLAVFTMVFLIYFGVPKLLSGTQDGIVFGIIIVFILMPIISGGLALFGYYSIIGEYSRDKMLQE